MSEDTHETTPIPWWQKMLTTPALLLALGGGIGTAVPPIWAEYKAWRTGIESSRTQIVAEQQALWEANLNCLYLKPVYAITIGEGSEVGVTLCSSGAALLRYQRASGVATYTWIPFPKPPKGITLPDAKALDLQNPITRVVFGGTRCVMLQGQMVLWVLYRDEVSAEACRIEYIATVSGRLAQRRDVACALCDS